jgi:hypothetical protein
MSVSILLKQISLSSQLALAPVFPILIKDALIRTLSHDHKDSGLGSYEFK